MANPVTGVFIRPFMQRKNAKKLAATTTDGIQEERFIPIGGIEQWVTIRGRHRANPILVVLHGGPASPYTPFNAWITEWEEYFTIVQWDQRGAGKTYSKNGQSGSGELSFKKLAEDGVALISYITEYLNQPKVILLGSSVGSFIGLLIASQRPELLHAYVGAEQNAPGGIELSYKLTLDAANKAGDRKALKALRSMGAYKKNWTYQQFLRMNKLSIDLTKDVPHMVHDLMLPALLFAPHYTMKDIKAVQQGMEYSAAHLFKEMRDFDFDALGYTFEVPFFVLQGESDIITPVATAQAYVQQIHAPHKGFATISHAGHLAEFCNPSEFLSKLRSFVPSC